MKKLFLFVLINVLVLTGCSTNTVDSKKPIIAVSIVPQETFVKAVAGDLVDVVVMIPPGNSPANYQPTPKQMTVFDSADIYFSIGVTAESNIKPLINSEKINMVYLEEVVEAVYDDRYFDEDSNTDDHDHEGRDPHIWLSPMRVILMVETIKNELIELDPDNREIYENNASEYISELVDLDEYLKESFKMLKTNEFIIYHPAFGYFADDYNLEMITIEEEGKEATARRLEEVIDLAKDHNIQFILYQEEFDNQQAELIAKEINGTAIKVAPLSEDYINNLKNIGNKLKDILN